MVGYGFTSKLKMTKAYDKIIFDCDSTLVKIEGLDELAKDKGKKNKVTALTKLAMDGVVKLEEVFALKMAMIRPSKKDLIKLGQIYIKNVSEDVKEVINLLKILKKDILQITGNFYPAVKILSDYLKIQEHNIYANKIYFNEDGKYLGFDAKGLLSISGGKKLILQQIYKINPNIKTVFIGDGSTDLDTKPPVDLFIGYGGVVYRENVRKHSDIYITCESLTPILRFVLNKIEQKKGEQINKNLFTKADILIKKGYVYIKTE